MFEYLIGTHYSMRAKSYDYRVADALWGGWNAAREKPTAEIVGDSSEEMSWPLGPGESSNIVTAQYIALQNVWYM